MIDDNNNVKEKSEYLKECDNYSTSIYSLNK